MATLRAFVFASRHCIDSTCRTCLKSELFSKYWHLMTTESLEYIRSALLKQSACSQLRGVRFLKLNFCLD
jgi:hypothetical protein